MSKGRQKIQREIPALKVQQWLTSWEDIHWDPQARQSKPQEYFYLFTMNALELKALTGVYRRSVKELKARADDPFVQRGHESERSQKIRRFVQYGYPWCEMSESKRQSGKYKDLKKPGWLPTAIVVNILTENDPRNISKEDLIQIRQRQESSFVDIILPESFSGPKWRPKSIPPMEVIDGQHRLWAFEKFDLPDTFELPVVAFYGLDRSWQAYLFWTINVTPKRINASLAFDLYPLLRMENWLERFHGHSIYRETRAQELVEALWSHPQSPWYQRINMLGERGLSVPMVSQSAWIRSLMATYLKQWEGRGTRVGGLFGAPLDEDKPILPWSRAQQAAFLIAVGQAILEAIKNSKYEWAEALRKVTENNDNKTHDPAFFGKHTLLTTDQGIRGILYITNDLCWQLYQQLELTSWRLDFAAATDRDAVDIALKSLKKQKFWSFLKEVGKNLASYDWRTSSAPGLSIEQQQMQAAFRGSGGYKLLRLQLLSHLSKHAPSQVAKTANKLKEILEG